MSKAVFNKTIYRAGCDMCYGLAVQWEGDNARDIALKHARQTGHKGIWYECESHNLYNVTEDMTMEDWDELERRPADHKPPILVSDITIGRRMKAARNAKEMTQAQVAEHLGIARPTYINIEHGERRATYEELTAIAAILGTTVEALTTREEVPV